jgi:hypothetical protein
MDGQIDFDEYETTDNKQNLKTYIFYFELGSPGGTLLTLSALHAI